MARTKAWCKLYMSEWDRHHVDPEVTKQLILPPLHQIFNALSFFAWGDEGGRESLFNFSLFALAIFSRVTTHYCKLSSGMHACESDKQIKITILYLYNHGNIGFWR